MEKFILLALATWRISSLLVHEAGPGHIFHRLRMLVGMKYNPDSFQVYPSNMVAEIFNCVWCMSIYIGTGLAIAHRLAPKITEGLTLICSLSAVAVLLDEYVQGQE